MNRRAFLTTAAAVGAVLPAPVACAAVSPATSVKRVYRRAADGKFRLVAWEDVAAGDRIILVSEFAGELLDCETITVAKLVPAGDDRPAGEVAFVVDDTKNFSDLLHPYYDEPRADSKG
jgi:hypothetical protein